MKIKIQFANYKQLKDFTADFETGNLYFVRGSNGIGKTSFLQGLLATVEGKGTNKKAISFGAAEASIKTQILEFKGADGQDYSIKYELSEGKADKFTIVKPDTTVSKKAGDISTIFHYNAFTVDEWFAWGMTADGRRKQAQVIMNMLPVMLQQELKALDVKVNATNGTLFEDRKAAKAIWENKKIEHTAITFTDHETKMLALTTYEQDTKDIAKKREDALVANSGSAGILVSQATLKAGIISLQETIERTGKEQIAYREKTALAIEEHKASILDLQTLLESSDLEFEQEQFEYQQSQAKNESDLAAIELKLAEKVIVDIPALDASLAIRAEYVKILKTAEGKVERQKILLEEVQSAFAKTERLTAELEVGRMRKKEIISTAKLPVDNIAIEGDEIFYVDPTGLLLPFSEENISYAKGGFTVAQIMLAVNKDLPLLLVGKAAEYDNKSLEALSKLAEANGAIIILDRVIPELSALEIECYEGGTVVSQRQAVDKSTFIPKPTTDLVGISNEHVNKPFDL